MHTLALAAEYVPAEQLVQVDVATPVEDEYFPAEQLAPNVVEGKCGHLSEKKKS